MCKPFQIEKTPQGNFGDFKVTLLNQNLDAKFENGFQDQRSCAVLVSRGGFHAGKPSSRTKRIFLKDMGTISPKSAFRNPLEIL